MNNPSSNINNSENKDNSVHMMRFGKQQVQHWSVYLTLGIIAAVLSVVIITLDNSYQDTQDHPVPQLQKSLKQPVFTSEKHAATDNLINKLKQYGMWSDPPVQNVPRFFIESYPPDLYAVNDISIKKKVFLHSLLPHALFVRQEALRKRGKLQVILSKIDCSLQDIDFVDGYEYATRCSWSESLAEDEVSFIQDLCLNYRTTSAEILLERVDAVPTSIILAQGALESSWGSSRFTREGNSLFGMWTWKTKGIVPSKREEGKTHKVKVYENVLDSVRAYHLTLNRLEPYTHFRQLRLLTDDPLVMAEGLSLYSERGEEYVEDIKKVIQSNNLQKYDSCSLSDSDLPDFSGPVKDTSHFNESGKVSL